MLRLLSYRRELIKKKKKSVLKRAYLVTFNDKQCLFNTNIYFSVFVTSAKTTVQKYLNRLAILFSTLIESTKIYSLLSFLVFSNRLGQENRFLHAQWHWNSVIAARRMRVFKKWSFIGSFSLTSPRVWYLCPVGKCTVQSYTALSMIPPSTSRRSSFSKLWRNSGARRNAVFSGFSAVFFAVKL